MANGAMSEALRRERVVIFGAGVTGLSAAHELAERGFEVEVIEECPHPLRPWDCQVGGMARTQWSRFPTGEAFDELARQGMRRARPLLCLDSLFNPTLDDTRERVDRSRLRARGVAWGEPIDRGRHLLRHEVKAVTYHQLKIVRGRSAWRARIVFDI